MRYQIISMTEKEILKDEEKQRLWEAIKAIPRFARSTPILIFRNYAFYADKLNSTIYIYFADVNKKKKSKKEEEGTLIWKTYKILKDVHDNT